jgi:SIR2-like domain
MVHIDTIDKFYKSAVPNWGMGSIQMAPRRTSTSTGSPRQRQRWRTASSPRTASSSANDALVHAHPPLTPATNSPVEPISSLDSAKTVALEVLKSWPHAKRQLLQAPMPSTIEHHAIALLSRALHLGRLTAFVGSGASIAYGRISWNDMLYKAQQTVLQKYDTILRASPSPRSIRLAPQPEQSSKLLTAYTVMLADLLQQIKIERDTDADASTQLTVFQLSEELDNALRRDVYQRSIDSHKEPTFREAVMWATLDERGYAEQMLQDAFSDCELVDHKKVRSALWGTENEPFSRAAHRVLPHPGPHMALNSALIWIDSIDDLTGAFDFDRIEDVVGHVVTLLLSPRLRYRVAAWLRGVKKQKRVEILNRIEALLSDLRTKQHGRRNRSDIFPKSRDPLLILHRDLGIRRFLTTNYDHEIETLLLDCKYPRRRMPERSSVVSGTTDPMSPGFVDVVFDKAWTGNTSALATSDASRDSWVIHLHGRAEIDGRGRIIVTEDDYQRHYARSDASRPLIDDAVRLAFSAQPIMFVGIGMDEIDLLRPLREFMSSPARLGDRVVIALLPADDLPTKLAKRKIDLLRRYGVYTIHYGRASSTGTAGATLSNYTDWDRHPFWLAWLRQFRKAADQVLKLLESLPADTPIDNAEWQGGLKGLTDAALKVLYEPGKMSEMVDAASVRGIRQFVTPLFIEGSDDLSIGISSEMKTLNLISRFIHEINSKIATTNDFLQLNHKARGLRLRLAGAYSALQTTCLCASLRRLNKVCRQIHQEEHRLPSPRPVNLGPVCMTNFPPMLRPKGHKFQITQRHALDLVKLESQKAGTDPAANVIPLLDRFYSGAPSQTYNALMSAITKPDAAAAIRMARYRRIFLLVARRGVGRGHFFGALENEQGSDRLPAFLKAIAKEGERWGGAAFLNLSFSIEVSTVFDRISQFIWEHYRVITGPKHGECRNFDQLSGDRIGKLRFCLEILRDRYDASKGGRLFIAFNAINILFDSVGRPKNRQFDILFDLLICPENAKVPIDFMLVCTDNAIPMQFRSTGYPFTLLNPQGLSARRDQDIKKSIALLGLTVGTRRSRTNAQFVHILQQARASVLVSAFFPSVALVLARDTMIHSSRGERLLDLGSRCKDRYPHVLMPETAQRIRMELKNMVIEAERQNKDGWLAQGQKLASHT